MLSCSDLKVLNEDKVFTAGLHQRLYPCLSIVNLKVSSNQSKKKTKQPKNNLASVAGALNYSYLIGGDYTVVCWTFNEL